MRPEPPEDVQADHEAGAEPEAEAGVHHGAEADLQPEIQPAAARTEATADRVVPGRGGGRQPAGVWQS